MSHFFARRTPRCILNRRVDEATWNALANPTPLNITNLDVAEEERDAYIQAMCDRAIQRTVDRIRAIGRMNQLAQLTETAHEPASEDEVFGEPI